MSAARDLPARPSLDSLRKQAKRLARDAAAGNAEAMARVREYLPGATLPLANRDAQFVIAREYGFAGWPALSAEVQKRAGDGLNWAASQAKVAIHDENYDRLRELLAEYPALVTWREGDQTLLDSTTSYAMDVSDPERERTYTRPIAMEMLIDAGAVVEQKTWEHVIKTGASRMLGLLHRKNAVPRTPPVLAALGEDPRELSNEKSVIDHALLVACRFKHTDLAMRLLDRAIVLDSDLGRRIDRWRGRAAFIGFLEEQSGLLWGNQELSPWQRFVVSQLASARDRGDLDAFRRWLDDEPWVLGAAFVHVQVGLMLPACYEREREAFIVELLGRDPAILHTPSPPASHWSLTVQALSYGNAHLVPMLTRIWPLPNDLAHAAGVGDAAGVARWFDSGGRPVLGSLDQQYPHSDARFPRGDLRWGPPTAQQVLDVALAFAVLNKHFEIASFLLERGADINTDWATHEPASILHEAAVQGNEEAVRFLVDHGADLTKTDYRYHGTAEGWARYGSNDEKMADLLAKAAADRGRPSV